MSRLGFDAGKYYCFCRLRYILLSFWLSGRMRIDSTFNYIDLLPENRKLLPVSAERNELLQILLSMLLSGRMPIMITSNLLDPLPENGKLMPYTADRPRPLQILPPTSWYDVIRCLIISSSFPNIIRYCQSWATGFILKYFQDFDFLKIIFHNSWCWVLFWDNYVFLWFWTNKLTSHQTISCFVLRIESNNFIEELKNCLHVCKVSI